MRTVLFLSLFAPVLFGFGTVNLQDTEQTGSALTFGMEHACALSEDGEIFCWGTEIPAALLNVKFKGISAGATHTCALREEGEVVCWGENIYGEANAPKLSKIKQISAGDHTSCALSESGKVSCWGSHVFGIHRTENFPKISQISVGAGFACAIEEKETERGDVFCWGQNIYKETNHPDLHRTQQISSGSGHTCALSLDGEVRCWGQEDELVQVPTLPKIKQISTGYLHACALSEAGKVSCWGFNRSGQTSVPALSDILRIYSSGRQTCAVQKEGDVICWGDETLQIPESIQQDVLRNGSIPFVLESVENSFNKLSKRLYSYKGTYVKKLSVAVSGQNTLASRYFAMELLLPLLETTTSPFIQQKVVARLRSGLNTAKKKLNVDQLEQLELTPEILSVAITASKHAVESCVPFIINEELKADSEKFVTGLGILSVGVKTNGRAPTQELLKILEENSKLIETLTTEPRTTGFGLTLQKIKNYLGKK